MWGKKKKQPALFQRNPRRFWYVVSAGVCLAILLVAARGELGMYIHPRYQVFTILMMMAAALLLLVAAAQYHYKKQTDIEFTSWPQLIWLFTRWLLRRSAWIPLLVALLIVFVPAKPLLSDAAERRQLSEYEQRYVREANWFYKPETVYQLSSVLQLNEGLTAQTGKTFTLSGFVDDDPDPNIFRLSRFVVSCCTVDARPATVSVYLPGWQEQLKIDEWAEVTGKIEVTNTGAGHRPVLIPTEVNAIPQPKDPYNYL